MGFLSDFGAGLKRQISTIPLTYLGGHPDLQGGLSIGAGKNESSVVFYAGPTFKSVLEIPKKDVVNVTLDKMSHRSLGKAAAGALIGGVLTGGIGAVAGAVIGGRRKDDSVIVMTIKYGSSDVEILLGGDGIGKKYSQFVALLR